MAMHGMWNRFRIIGKRFETLSQIYYDLAEKSYPLAIIYFLEDLLTIIRSAIRLFGHNYKTTFNSEKRVLILSLTTQFLCAVYKSAN